MDEVKQTETSRPDNARPHRVALVDLGKADGPCSILLDDFDAATRAYERLSKLDPALEIVRDEVDGADAVVVAVEGGVAANLALALAACPANTSVYSIVATESTDADENIAELEVLAHAVEGHGCVWRGGVVVGACDLVRPLMRYPRLGWIRRPVFEAIDRQIMSMRLGWDSPIEAVRPRLVWLLRHIYHTT